MLPFMQNKLQDQGSTIDGAISPQGNARAKVKQDIAFLRDRITAMQAHPRPNTLLIEHYQSMLRSRESVFKWLLDGCDDETSHLHSNRNERLDDEIDHTNDSGLNHPLQNQRQA